MCVVSLRPPAFLCRRLSRLRHFGVVRYPKVLEVDWVVEEARSGIDFDRPPSVVDCAVGHFPEVLVGPIDNLVDRLGVWLSPLWPARDFPTPGFGLTLSDLPQLSFGPSATLGEPGQPLGDHFAAVVSGFRVGLVFPTHSG